MRIVLIAFVALVVAGGSGLYLFQGALPAPQPAEAAAQEAAPQPAAVEIFVPARGLAAGTLLGPDHLTRIRLDPRSVNDEMIAADEDGRTLLLGSVARQSLAKGVPIARSAIVQPGERGFLAAVLPRGKRAISIPIGEAAGVSGLVTPGDRVDIILTYSIAGDLLEAGRDIRASETILANLRILALDQRLQDAPGEAGEAPGVRPIARTATLEVAPQEAEMLTLATRLGDLSLVLNSIEDGGEPVVAEEEGASRLAAIAAAVQGAAPPGPRRPMTLDSHVTSLLQGDAPAGPDGAPPPARDRAANVQIVRGIDSHNWELRPALAEAEAARPVPPTLEAAEPIATLSQAAVPPPE
jgi:pilus assembly protein CpaB